MDDVEQVYGTSDETGIFVDYASGGCDVYFKLAGEVVPPTRSTVVAVIEEADAG